MTEREGPHLPREEREYGQCQRKKAYTTVKAANRAARGAARFRGTETRVYDCPHCGAMHLTSMVDLRPTVRVGRGGWDFKPDGPVTTPKPHKGMILPGEV